LEKAWPEAVFQGEVLKQSTTKESNSDIKTSELLASLLT
jgi:hypothetical protein